jgi:16S rRNA (adenine1518-N6/adenine1519-N6)-dimethyltransferase
MGELARPSVVVDILQSRGVRLTKTRGQHFLVDGNVLRRLIVGSDLQQEDTALEIGPGIGTLTEELCDRAARVVAIEMDRRLAAILRDMLGSRHNLEVVEGDAMRMDLAAPFAPAERVKMVSNLPYNVATPLLVRALRELPQLLSITATVQRELADRYLAHPGTSAYGAVSVKLQLLTEIRRLAQVPPTVFLPPPRVESTIVHFERKETGLSASRLDAFFTFVNASFSSRRKKLVNSLSGGRNPYTDKSKVEDALYKTGLSDSCRAEELSPEQLLGLYEEMAQ